jgi:hypothetical protein
MPAGIDWAVILPTIFASVTSGTVAGAIISTYGGHGRERREARSSALTCLQKIEVGRRTGSLAAGTPYDSKAFAELISASMIAGIPRSVTAVHDQIFHASHRLTTPVTPPISLALSLDNRDAVLASVWLSNESARLVGDALWHPRFSVFHRWRARRLRKKAMMLYGGLWQPSLTRATYRKWLKAEIGTRSARRRAVRAAKGALPGEG